MKPFSCCNYYFCIYVPPDEMEYPKKKLKKNFDMKFDEILKDPKINNNKEISKERIKKLYDEIDGKEVKVNIIDINKTKTNHE